jgi:hypothetical protein
MKLLFPKSFFELCHVEWVDVEEDPLAPLPIGPEGLRASNGKGGVALSSDDKNIRGAPLLVIHPLAPLKRGNQSENDKNA